MSCNTLYTAHEQTDPLMIYQNPGLASQETLQHVPGKHFPATKGLLLVRPHVDLLKAKGLRVVLVLEDNI